MNEVEVTQKALALLREKSGYEGDIGMLHPLAGMLNSITYIQFLIACEDAFEIEIEDDELDMAHFSTVQDVVGFLFRKVFNHEYGSIV
jgi:acyl carrier protein